MPRKSAAVTAAAKGAARTKTAPASTAKVPPRKAAPAKSTAAKPARPGIKAAARVAAKSLAAPAAKRAARKSAALAARDLTPVRPLLVRDSFTMPEQEYAILADVKQACLRAGIDVKKSELLRIGVALLGQVDIPTLKAVLAALPQLKTGRPPASS